MKHFVDDKLDEYKRMYDSLDHVLDKVTSDLTEKAPNEMRSSINCMYFPQLGFLTVVPSQTSSGAEGSSQAVLPSWQDKSWEVQFSTAQSFYFKSDQMSELDEYFGDIYSTIVDREVELLHQLEVRVLEFGPMLVECSAICAELDW